MHSFQAPSLAALIGVVLCCGASAQSFVDVTQSAGLGGFPLDTAIYFDGVHATGMCAADFDRDDDVDLVIPESYGGQIRYFRNDGNLQFSEQTVGSGLGGSLGPRAVRAADVDNDGDLDLYLSNWNQPPQLYINNGSAHFVDEAAARGLVHRSSAWGAGFGDIDNDGWLDLYIGNRFVENRWGTPEPSILYRNTGGGSFVDITRSAGVSVPGAATLFGVFFDYDEDGWMDLYVVNDKGSSYSPNDLYRNNRDNTFTSVGRSVGAIDAVDGMGFDEADVFNDGGFDFFVSDVAPDHLFRVWNPQLNLFTDETSTFGLQGGYTGWASHFFDHDNDGWLDLHVVHQNGPNHLYVNPAHAQAAAVPWTELGDALAPATRQLTAALADFDNDGRIDILHRFVTIPGGPTEGLELHRNITPVRHWLKVRTVGTVANRDGFGAKVELTVGGVTQRQHSRAGIGFHSTSDHRLHFGLGNATRVDRIDVTWPSGQVQSFHDVAADRTLTVIEPRMRLAGAPAVGTTTSIELEAANDVGKNFAIFLAGHESPGTPLPDGQVLPVAFDALSVATLTPGNPVLQGGLGVLGSSAATAQLTIPPNAALSGLRFYATGFTYDPTSLPLGTVFPKALQIDLP